MKKLLPLMFPFFIACSEKVEESAEETEETEEVEETEETEETEDLVCGQDYSFCGELWMPEDMPGTPRSMAISLYDTLSPAGPPNVTVTEIDAPAVAPGEMFPVEFSPLIATGEYYVFVFLYMEGGGEWAPVPGVDFFGHTTEPITFDGSPVDFPAINLEMAEETE